MSKFEDALGKYKTSLNKLGKDVDEDLLRKVTKGLGPSIYNNDTMRVSCSDAEERKRVKTNFLMKKMGLEDDGTLDDAVKQICEEMKSEGANKYRAVFYYLLVKKHGLESKYA